LMMYLNFILSTSIARGVSQLSDHNYKTSKKKKIEFRNN